jgi:hypothetical protein
MVRENLRIAQSRQKSFIDHRRELSFEVGGYMYLKLSIMKGLRRFRIQGKVAPIFFGPFKITKEREEELNIEFPNFISNLLEREVGSSHPKIWNFGM